MLCNFVIVHFYVYSNHFCNEFTYEKNFVNKISHQKIGTQPARSALWY